MSAKLLAALEQVVGTAGLHHGVDLSAWEIDWRRRFHGKALAVVQPQSTSQVAAVVRLCNEYQIPMVPQGGNTGLVGGSVPDESGREIVLSLARMRQVRQIDTLNRSICVEAGCTLSQVQAAAREVGLLFPLSLASQDQCTIGGNLASNAGGTQVLRYGNARDLCLGLEVVTAQGQVWNGLRSLRKDNAGYDLRGLFLGSEGTLGLITAATLSLYAQPRSTGCALLACPSLSSCLSLFGAAQERFDARLVGFELISLHSLALIQTHFPALVQGWPRALHDAPWLVLLELNDTQDQPVLDDALVQFLSAQAGVIEVVIAQDLRQQESFWQARESISSAQALEGLNIKHDISLPLSALTQFVEQTGAHLQGLCPGVRLVTFGHVGDGNLHYNVQAPRGMDPALFLQTFEVPINRVVFDAVHQLEGSIAAEHGVGSLRLDDFYHYADTTQVELMRRVKLALDPCNLFNPNRLLRR